LIRSRLFSVSGVMSPMSALTSAWISATLLRWRTLSLTSVEIEQPWPGDELRVIGSDNAETIVAQTVTSDDCRHETSDDVCHALLASGLFNRTDPAAVSRWCECLKPVRFPPGQVIGARGDFGGCLYVVISGKVKVSDRRPDGCENMLTIVGDYEIFGAVALFDPAACEASATALTEVLAVPIEHSQLLIWVAECSGFSAQVLRLFARWTRATTNTLTEFAFSDVHGRLASRLLWLRQRFGRREGDVVRIEHGLTMMDFSRFVGLSPESVGETLREFEGRGWNLVDHKSVVVVDSHALASVRSKCLGD
jgi:CRP/FNR family transcriptional regulator, cyclic AMP receptor protein